MKVLLSIAGSDSSGGAGIQADIKTSEHFGVFCTTAITALTAQNTKGVSEVSEVSADFVYEQIHTILEDINVDVIKIGMLFDSDIIEVVKEVLNKVSVPVVLDPVFISKAGSTLLKEDAQKAISSLFPYVTLITPNMHEAKALFGEKLDINAPCPVLVKNRLTSPQSVDTLYYANRITKDYEGEFLDSQNLHGTGCSFSTAIAANLALEKPLEEAIDIAKRYVFNGIKQAPNIGNGNGPILHKIAL